MTDPWLPPQERREILRQYGEQYGLRVFVETGTANGDTPAHLMPYFDQLYTIEVGVNAYHAACVRFMGTNVQCIHGDSAQQLPKVLDLIGSQPALFWLDGHASGGDRAEKDTPIIEELQAIFATGVPHVILIDDLRLFGGQSHYGEWDWPHTDELTGLASTAGYEHELAGDIMRLTPSEAEPQIDLPVDIKLPTLHEVRKLDQPIVPTEETHRRFKIASTGWMCAQWIEQTLKSVEEQSNDDWEIQIVYNGDDGGDKIIRKWCDARDDRWKYLIKDHRDYGVKDQYEAIRMLDPRDDDIVIFLDLDGDRLAHQGVLDSLAAAYADGVTLLTYGNYEPIPNPGTCPPAKPFPEDVVRHNSYRNHMRYGECCFNHLRTMRGRLINAIGEEQFKWYQGNEAGEWYKGAMDYIFMIPALELAGPRHKCLTEVLCFYNHANERADNKMQPTESTNCVHDVLSRPALGTMR